MRRFHIFIFLCSVFGLMSGVGPARAQSAMPGGRPGMNWVAEFSPANELTTLEGLTDSVPYVVQYFDGLGKRVQSVSGAYGAAGKGIAAYTEYDSRGRVSREWQAAPSADNHGSFTPLSQLQSGYESPSYAFAKATYEASPQGRVVEQRKPGQPWHTATQGVTTEYLYNEAQGELACFKVYVDASSNVVCSGVEQSGWLTVTRVTDEDGNRTLTFTDVWGNQLLSRHVSASGTTLDLYHIYDVHGRMRVALSPKGSATLLKAGYKASLSDKDLLAMAHVYDYDSRGRVNRVAVPGGGTTRLFHTPYGEVCYSQDLVQQPDREWTYQCYDAQCRPVCRGTMVVPSGEPPESFGATRYKMQFDPTAENSIYGYVGTLSYIKEADCLAVDYYDDYRFLSLFAETADTLRFTAKPGYPQRVESMGKGRLTGSLRRVVSPEGVSGLLLTAYYYDKRGNLIQSRSTNHLGGYDATYHRVGFDGRVLATRTEHCTCDTLLVAEHTFTYDALGTPIGESFRQAGSTTATQLTATTLDALRRPVTLSMLGGFSPVQVQYSYTAEGALEQIASEPFTQTIYRECRPDGTAGYLSGLTSGISVALATNNPSVALPASESMEATYSFTYDAGRLTAALYRELSRTVPQPSSASQLSDLHISPNYSCIYSYDLNGNPTSIARFGMTEEKYVSTTIGLRRMSRRQVYYGLVDDLTLEYDGNVLKKVTDEAEQPDYAEANDFVDGADKSVEYEYDAMGRLIKDLNKGIDLIRYNLLGQPCDIRSGVNHIYITYDSDGAVLSKVYGMDETIFIPPTSPWGVTRTETRFVPSLTRAWAGQYEYEDGRFTRMYTSIGWIDRDGRHTALIKDWQGNVRAAWHQGDYAVADASATIPRDPAKLYTGLTGYYPYGLPWATVQSKDRHLYSAKELERASGLLLYDFHARQYDPQLCRFTAPDPLSHAYEALAPHLYCAANPITFTDPTGLKLAAKLEGDETRQYTYFSIVNREVTYDMNLLKTLSPENQDKIKVICSALNEIAQSKYGMEMIKVLIESSHEVVIEEGNFEKNDFTTEGGGAWSELPEMHFIGVYSKHVGAGGTVKWNPSITEGGKNTDGNFERPAFISLAHELGHAYDCVRGLMYPTEVYENADHKIYYPDFVRVPKSEWNAVYHENMIRRDLKLPLRIRYFKEDLTKDGKELPDMLMNGKPVPYP